MSKNDPVPWVYQVVIKGLETQRKYTNRYIRNTQSSPYLIWNSCYKCLFLLVRDGNNGASNCLIHAWSPIRVLVNGATV